MKSLYREKTFYEFFCPLCRKERRVRLRPNPLSMESVVRVGLTTAVLTLITWNWFGGWGAFFFLPVWSVYETVYRLKVRTLLTCDSCGLDPILYLADVKRARAGVEKHWKDKSEPKEAPKEQSKDPKNPTPQDLTSPRTQG